MTAKKSAPAARTLPKHSGVKRGKPDAEAPGRPLARPAAKAAKAAGTPKADHARSPHGRKTPKPAPAAARPGDDGDSDVDLSDLEFRARSVNLS